MIQSITVTNHNNESLTIPLNDYASTGFLIKSIDGIGPVDADINTTDIASSDGALFNSSRISTRNITIKFLFQPRDGETAEDLRQKCYKFFPVSGSLTKKIKFAIKTDNRDVYTYGYVEKNDPTIFSTSSSTFVGNDISIICPDSFLYANSETNVVFSGVEDAFEFPFSNESTTENLIEFGTIKASTYSNVYYDGDDSVGFTMIAHINGTVRDLSIYNIDTREVMSINDDLLESIVGSKLQDSDELYINTTKGNKSITLLRSGVEYNILNALGTDTDWFTLLHGDNQFAYTASEGIYNIYFTITCQTLYQGV